MWGVRPSGVGPGTKTLMDFFFCLVFASTKIFTCKCIVVAMAPLGCTATAVASVTEQVLHLLGLVYFHPKI